VHIVSTRLLNASSRGLVRVLVNGALELLQELVDVQEIALGPQVRERKRVRVVHRRVRSLSNHSATVAVLRHARRLVTTKNGELDTLETHQTLANVVVGGRINGTTLSIAEELVQCIVSRTLTDLIVVCQLLGLVDSIVDWAVSRVLRWASIKSGRSTSRMLLAVGALSKGTLRVLVSTRCSGKRLQVSDEFTTLTWVARGAVRTATVGLG
jgi:hypothetical protein